MRKDILNESKVEYGKQIVKKPLDKLTVEYGRGWSKNQLRHCLRTAEVFYKKYDFELGLLIDEKESTMNEEDVYL